MTRFNDEAHVVTTEEKAGAAGSSVKSVDASASGNDDARDAEHFSRLSPADFSAIYHVAFPW